MFFPVSVLGRFAAACTEHRIGVLGERSPEDNKVHVQHIPATHAPSGLPVEEGEVYCAAGLRDALAIKDEYRRTREEFFDNRELSDPKPELGSGSSGHRP